jgi:hypothetical protein
MKKINIEWLHYDKEGETCTRCNKTGDNIVKVIQKISDNPKFNDVSIKFIETKLEADKMPDSNTILIDGEKLEKIVGATSSENFCHSCSCLAGKGSNCRTICYQDEVYEDIPEEIIELGILKHLRK